MSFKNHYARLISLDRIADRRLILANVFALSVVGFLPLVSAILMSFCSVDSESLLHFGSFDGYIAAVSDGRIKEFFSILLRATIVVAIVITISIPAAFWVVQVKRSYQILILVLLVAPWLVSDMLRAFGWQSVLSPDSQFSLKWSSIFNNGSLSELRYSFSAVVIGLVSSLTPVGIITVLSSIPNRSKTEWLAAVELGRPYRVFSLMMLGRAIPGTMLAIFSIFTLSCFSTAEPHFLDGPTQSSIQSIGASLVNVSAPALFAFGTLLIAFVSTSSLTIYLLFRMVLSLRSHSDKAKHVKSIEKNRLITPTKRDGYLRNKARSLSDLTVKFAPGFATAFSIIICWIPISGVITEAFRQPSKNGWVWSFNNFELMAASTQLAEALKNSIEIALTVGLLTSLVAFCLSLVVWSSAFRRLVMAMLVVLLFLPGDVYGISTIQILKLFGHGQGGTELVIAAHTLWALPFATGTFMLANKSISHNLLGGALEYSSGPLSVILRVIARINVPSIVVVIFLSATLSLNEYVRSSYLAGSLITISNEVHGRLLSGMLIQNRGIFAAEFLIILISICVSMSIVMLIFRKSE